MAFHLFDLEFCFILILAVLFHVICDQRNLTCHSDIHSIGYTYPSGDINIEDGKYLEIFCTVTNEKQLNMTSHNASATMYFSNNGVKLTENVTIVNSTSIKYYNNKLKPHIYNFMCLLRDDLPVCLNTVIIGTKPSNITDFKCISYNYDNLTCTWTAPENYVKTMYNLTYSFGRNLKFTCPEITKYENKTMSCFWSIYTEPHYRHSAEKFNFTLSVSNPYGVLKYVYIIDHYANVKADPPEKLQVLNTTTNSILLYWKIPQSIQSLPVGLRYRVLYKCILSPKYWKLATIDNVVKATDGMYYNLTGLEYANDQCDVRVGLISDTAKDEMWSFNSSVVHRLQSTIPSATPKTNIGSFEVKKRSSSRDVYVYWQQIPEYYCNGFEFRYNITNVNHPDLKYTEKTNAYAKFTLDFSEHTFAIWSENENGPSRNTSYITIPSVNNGIRLPQSFTKIAYNDGKYKLQWEPPNQYSSGVVKNYTIFWCKHSRDRPYQCTGLLNWTEVSGDLKSYEVNLKENSNETWQFAISANNEHYSSGMLWAECTVLDNNSIKRIKEVYKIQVTDTSIRLGWKLDCMDGMSYIAGFIVQYCPIMSPIEKSCRSKLQNMTINGDLHTTEATVTGLKPYTTYSLSVAVKLSNGDNSDFSELVYETTLEGAPSEPLNLLAKEITNSSIMINWYQPAELNGILKYYWIYANDDEFKVDPKIPLEYHLTNLTSYENFTISVSACTTVCSERTTIMKSTLIGSPGSVSRPKMAYQNNSVILVDWNTPSPPRGKNDYYEIKILQKHDSTDAIRINASDNYYLFSCGENKKLDAFYIYVRAVNLNEYNNTLYGPWSDELVCYCSNSTNFILVIFLVILVLVCIFIALVFKKTIVYFKNMKNVELKLPPGLDTIPDWGTKGQQEPLDLTPTAADEELLLVKMTENCLPSGETSGCSSGNGSVVSESGTTFSNTSDSGTEQSILRKRPRNFTATIPVVASANTGYVTMPPEALNKVRTKPTTGNYCVLGVDPSTQVEPENAYVTVAPKDVGLQ